MKPSAVAEQQRDRLGLVAAAPPLIPPRSWFETPEPEDPSEGGWTVTADGQVYGYAALWESCHTGKPGRCVKPPRSASDYGYYMTGLTETDDGELIPTGRITLGTGHASLTASPAATAEHYDNTGAVAADVRITDGKHGIWVSGALRPDVTPERARVLRGASLSGDWRNIRGQLELLGLLAVNVPGFPVPRAMSASGELEDGEELLALVAAGVITEPICVEEGDEVDEADWDAALRNLTDAMAHSEEVTAAPLDPVTAALASTPASGTRYTDTGGGEGMAAAGRFDESKHPRHPKGTKEGGQFAAKVAALGLGESVDSPGSSVTQVGIRGPGKYEIVDVHGETRYASTPEEAAAKAALGDAEAAKLDEGHGPASRPMKTAGQRSDNVTDGETGAVVFTSKPGSVEDIPDAGDYSYRDHTEAQVVRKVMITPDEFDDWEGNLLADHPEWFGDMPPGPRGADGVVEITDGGDRTLWVNPEGYDYARYIARPPKPMTASAPQILEVPEELLEEIRFVHLDEEPGFIEELVAAMQEAIHEPGEPSSAVPLTAASPGRARARKIAEVMKEFKAGTLKTSDGTKVTDRKQALAIAMSKSEHLTAASFDETKHPRHKKGSKDGGKFAAKGDGDSSAESDEDAPVGDVKFTDREEGIIDLDFKNWLDQEQFRLNDATTALANAKKQGLRGGSVPTLEKQVARHKARIAAAKARKRGVRASADPMDLPAALPAGPRPDDAVTAASFTEGMRAKLAKKGEAMPDGSFPIRNRSDLRNAISSVGRASDPEVARKWIIRRARELKAVDALPAAWDVEAVTAAAPFEEAKHPRHKKGSEQGGQFAPKGGHKSTESAKGIPPAMKALPEGVARQLLDAGGAHNLPSLKGSPRKGQLVYVSGLLPQIGTVTGGKGRDSATKNMWEIAVTHAREDSSGRWMPISEAMKSKDRLRAGSDRFYARPVNLRRLDAGVVTAAGTFDESKHPRHKKGSKDGGQFAPKGAGEEPPGVDWPKELGGEGKAIPPGKDWPKELGGEGRPAGKLVTGPGGKPMSRTEAGELLDKERAGTPEAKADRAEKQAREVGRPEVGQRVRIDQGGYEGHGFHVSVPNELHNRTGTVIGYVKKGKPEEAIGIEVDGGPVRGMKPGKNGKPVVWIVPSQVSTSLKGGRDLRAGEG